MTMLIITLLSVIGGAVCCFAGYRIFRMALSLMGACLGAYLGLLLYRHLSGYDIAIMHMEYSEIVTVAVCAVLLGALAFGLYMKALVTVVTVICGWYLYSDSKALGVKLPWDSPLITLGICMLFGLVIGFAVYYLQKWAIIGFTAFIGAKIIASVLVPYLFKLVHDHQGQITLRLLSGSLSSEWEIIAEAVTILLLTGAGIAVQITGSKE